MTNLFSLRETEIFQTLKALSDCTFVLIGGYAVNAYTLPRFSVDCDIVVIEYTALKNIEKILVKRGYHKEDLNAESGYSGNFLRYEKKLDNNFAVSIDILLKKVSDRMTGVSFAGDWIFNNSKINVLKGKTITEELKLRIITRDALLVMKIISCRSTDIRDVFMMLPNATNKEWVQSEVARRCDFNDRMRTIIEKVSEKQFKDGLAGVYGSVDQKIFEKHKKAILSLQ